jgi:DNA-binding Lrp family transcriptional regulator
MTQASNSYQEKYPTSYRIDEVDKKILMLLQKGIPFCNRPYQQMADEIGGISEEEVIRRIGVLKREHIIRRMSGFFNSRKLGYTSVLCAIRVPEEHIEEVAALLNRFPGITHNYLRQHTYNMWFTLISGSKEELDKILQIIEQDERVEKVLRFYSQKRFKIDVTFDLQREVLADE